MTVECYRPVGADPNNENISAKFKLGTRAYANDDQEYVYVQASGSIALYDAVGIDEDFQAASLTTTTAAAMHKVGWACNHAFTNDYYGFVLVRGTNFLGNVADDTTADVPLFTSATAGVLNVSDSGVCIRGVTCIVAASGGGGSQLIATYPYLDEAAAT